MSYFYSEEMTYCECIMPREIAWSAVSELGKLQCVHFEKQSLNYSNPFVMNLRRCEALSTKLLEITEFIGKAKPEFKTMGVKDYRQLLEQIEEQTNPKDIHGHLFLNEVEEEIEQMHSKILKQKTELDNLGSSLSQYLNDAALFITLKHSLEFNAVLRDMNSERMFEYRCILINKTSQMMLEKGLFRISRGNIWIKVLAIDVYMMGHLLSIQADQMSQKVVCVIMHQKSDLNTLRNKIQRFLSCLQATELATQDQERWDAEIMRLNEKIQEVENLKNLTKDSVERDLYRLWEPRNDSTCSLLTFWQAYIRKESQVYFKLATMTVSQNFLHFNIFIPTSSLPVEIKPSENLPPLTLTPKQPPKAPPTKFDTPHILEIPQEILNTYGVPSYQEFNPAVFYLVTFGFFIGVMFGDVGHMLMIIPFVIYFQMNTWAWIVLFFMGYCGVIYNQFFGLNLALFTSCYSHLQWTVGEENKAVRIEDCVYPFGIDSIWKASTSNMQFSNSLKMKIAVILGVAHMMLGLGVRIINNVRQRKMVQLFGITLPQIVFMLCTFVYMDILIVKKWATDYTGPKSEDAPSIISIMITMYANFWKDSNVVLFPNQRTLEQNLLAVSALMIPLMLFSVPIATCIQRMSRPHLRPIDKQLAHEMISMDDNNEVTSKVGSQEQMKGSQFSRAAEDKLGVQESEQNEPLRQVMVYSFIETIEYVLGTVSNTASYLRLWALSLAHGQLSEVIFNLILEKSVTGGYDVIMTVFFTFPFFYIVTFGVLLCMDFMECFLHSLRLHWVEFQNKFYSGGGYSFKSFNFKAIHPLNE